MISSFVKTTNVLTKEPPPNKTNVVKRSNSNHTTFDVKEVEELIRADMWRELAQKNIWEGYFELKKTRIHECVQHRQYSKERSFFGVSSGSTVDNVKKIPIKSLISRLQHREIRFFLLHNRARLLNMGKCEKTTKMALVILLKPPLA